MNFKNYYNSKVAIAGRESLRSIIFFETIVQHQLALKVYIQNTQHQSLAGECTIDAFSRVIMRYLATGIPLYLVLLQILIYPC